MRGAALGLGLLAAAGCGERESTIVVVHADGTSEVVDCRTGCAAVTPDEHETLGDEEVRHLLGEMAKAPVGAEILPTETLLFNGAEVKAYLVRQGASPLPPAHEAWLRRELERDTVDVEFRLVAEDGALLGHRSDHLPLVTKHHLLLRDTGALGRLDVNGKVKRVGVKHLWARF